MCMAIDEMRNDSEIVGAVKALQDVDFSLDEAIARIAAKYGKTKEYVEELVKAAA